MYHLSRGMRSRTRRQTYSEAKGICVSDLGTIVRILKQNGGFVLLESILVYWRENIFLDKWNYNVMLAIPWILEQFITHSKWRRFPSIFAKFVLEERRSTIAIGSPGFFKGFCCAFSKNMGHRRSMLVYYSQNINKFLRAWVNYELKSYLGINIK